MSEDFNDLKAELLAKPGVKEELERLRQESPRVPPRPIKIFKGLLGWSNKRPGLEFYRWNAKVVPRHSSEWWRSLLVSERGLTNSEGSTVFVLVVPPGVPDSTLESIERSLRAHYESPE